MPPPLSQTTLPAPPWHAPLLIRASLACHVGAAVSVAPHPELWPWALGAVGVNQAVLLAACLSPRSDWLGANIRRLPEAAAQRREVALTFDDGPDPRVTPAVLDLLDAAGAKATFFCIAEQARLHRGLCRGIVQRGHSVQNHSERHGLGFAMSGPGGFSREVNNAQAALTDITGQAPLFFRAPAGVRNPFLGMVLERSGLRLVSWTRRGFDTVRRSPHEIAQRLSQRLAAGDVLVLHDGNCARSHSGQAVVLEALPLLLRKIAQQQLRCVTLPHAFRSEPA
jgi:peptidoglycan-N-acetylglucosamine deacetylase